MEVGPEEVGNPLKWKDFWVWGNLLLRAYGAWGWAFPFVIKFFIKPCFLAMAYYTYIYTIT